MSAYIFNIDLLSVDSLEHLSLSLPIGCSLSIFMDILKLPFFRWASWYMCMLVYKFVCLSICQKMIVTKKNFMLARQSKYMSSQWQTMLWWRSYLIWGHSYPCLCLLCDPISAQIPFLLCLHYVLCASFIPVHHPLRMWQTDLQLLSQAVQGINWSKNVLCYINTHIHY